MNEQQNPAVIALLILDLRDKLESITTKLERLENKISEIHDIVSKKDCCIVKEIHKQQI